VVTRRAIVAMVVAIGLAGIAFLGYGCEEPEEGTMGAIGTAKTVELCMACGQIKGSDLCCKPGQAKCPKCGFVKGSPSCCKIPKM